MPTVTGAELTEESFQRLRDLLALADDDQLRAFFEGMHAADIAECLAQVDEEARSRILFLLPPRATAEAIVLLDEAVRSDVLEDLSNQEVSEVLKQLPADDAVDLLNEFDDAKAEQIVEHLPPEQKAAAESLRQYAEDTAGGIMNTEFVSITADDTVADAIDEIRRLSEQQRLELYYIYCVDREGRLRGVVPATRLLAAPPSRLVESLMLKELFTAHVNDDQEEVKNKFDKYDLLALPVVDDDGRLVGVITHDDVLEVAEEEAEEDILYMAGTDAEELATDSVLRAAYVRGRWLLPCLCGTFVGASVAGFLAPSFPPAVFAMVIPFLMPIAAMGGNVGVQISTIVVRSLATGGHSLLIFRDAAWRELRIAALISVVAGLLAGCGAYYLVRAGLFGSGASSSVPVWRLSLSVTISMMCAVLQAGTLATSLPFVFRRFGIDPAIATGPLITTVNDALSATIYLLIALHLAA